MKMFFSSVLFLAATISTSAKAQAINDCSVDPRDVSAALMQSTDELIELKAKGFESSYDVTCMRGVTGFKSYTLEFTDFDTIRHATLTVGLNLRAGRAKTDPLVYAKRLTYLQP